MSSECDTQHTVHHSQEDGSSIRLEIELRYPGSSVKHFNAHMMHISQDVKAHMMHMTQDDLRNHDNNDTYADGLIRLTK